MALDKGRILVINLDLHAILGLQPSVFVCSTEGELPAFALYKLSTGNAADHGILTESPMYRLLLESERYTPEKVIAHFSQKKKSARNLTDLLKEPTLQKALENYTQSKVQQWLSLAIETMLPIGTGIRRNELVRPCLLRFVRVEEPPLLRFKRTADGLFYQLLLRKEGRRIPLLTETFHPLANEAGWAIAGRLLLHVPSLPALFLKPFTSKDEVFIPEQHVPVFMKRFLLRAAQNADMEAEGFEVEEIDQITAHRLSLTEDLFTGHYKWRVTFQYQGESFHGYEQRTGKQRLKETESGVYKILRYTRNRPAESEALQPLLNMGLRAEPTGWLQWEEAQKNADITAAATWITERYSDLRKAGFEVEPVATPWGTLIPEQPALSEEEPEEGNDWFDLHARVSIAGQRFPLTHLQKTFLEKRPFHTLPDGRCFLVPPSWQSDYAPWFATGKVENGQLRLTKAQFSAMKAARVDEDSSISEKTVHLAGHRPPATLQATLRSYQVAGFSWLVSHYQSELGACLADDMGLGKTLQTIALLLHIHTTIAPAQHNTHASGQLDLFGQPTSTSREPLQALIIAPAGLLYNWQAECQRFAPDLATRIHRGLDRSRRPEPLLNCDVIITSYQVAVRDADMLATMPLRCIVLDESHQIKNRDTKTFKAVARLRAPFRLTLTGTPVENSLSDLWSQMQFINPGLLGSYETFRKHFQLPVERHGDTATRDQLRRMVGPYILRRLKQDVLPDLPSITEQIVYVDMEEAQSECYHREKGAVRQTILHHLAEGNPVSSTLVLNALMRLRQIAICPALLPEYLEIPSAKVDTILTELDTIARAGHRGLIFSSFRKHLDKYRKWLASTNWRCGSITGEDNPKDRLKAEHAFQSGELDFLLITLKAGGTGLNLTAADYVILADPWWNPAAERQAIDRAYRIGQKNPVMVLRFITRNTIEEKIRRLQERKSQWSEQLFEESFLLAGLTPEELAGLVD